MKTKLQDLNQSENDIGKLVSISHQDQDSFQGLKVQTPLKVKTSKAKKLGSKVANNLKGQSKKVKVKTVGKKKSIGKQNDFSSQMKLPIFSSTENEEYRNHLVMQNGKEPSIITGMRVNSNSRQLDHQTSENFQTDTHMGMIDSHGFDNQLILDHVSDKRQIVYRR